LGSPQGIGLLSALTFIVLLVLLLMRRRTAEQERELDHALRGEEPLLPGQPDIGEDLSGGEDDGGEDVYTTRLKLAEAYLEMGDTDGATEMLEEVMADGNLEQQEVARRIMERVDNGDE
jgi:pilus assembly protein FimV